ncbi:MAG: tetratricopeptide repeat protein [Deltaproteobacteria bacterium]|nr:tetratricopeptide repeat protein [Deltaproteobacteria bacterium]
MAVDKNKVTAEATRYAQRGQWDRAIKSYERILAEDPKDVRALLKVGELHQKRGDEAAAAATFGRVAEAYSEQGFFLKAIAVYKQMMKLAPEDVRVNERLAALYQQLGIMSDAMAQLQLVAAAAEKQGDQTKLFDVLGRMAEIEPDNVGSAVKLGEIHARAGRTAEALDQFRRAADLLRKANRADEYLRVAERIAFLAPDDMGLTRELANIYLAKGDTKRALAKLQLCFKADPKDIDTLNLLAQAFRDLGQTTKTLSVYKELAHVYTEKGRGDEARATWRKVLELAPDDPDAAAGLAGPAVAPPPRAPPPPAGRGAVIAPPPPPAAPAARVAAAPPQAPTPAPARPSAAPGRALGPEAIPKLLTETDVYVKYGLHQKALDHLRKVFDIDADHLDAREKARDIRAMAGDATGAAEEAARALRICVERGLADRATAARARLREIAPAHPDLGGAGEPGPAPVEEELLIEPEVTPAEVPAQEVQEDFLVEATPVEGDELALTGAEVGVEEVVDDDEAALAAARTDDEQVVEDEVIVDDEGPVVDDEPLGPPPAAAAPMPFPAPPRLTPPPAPPSDRLTPTPGPPPLLPTPPPVASPPRLTPSPAHPRLTPQPVRPTPPPVTPPPRLTPSPAHPRLTPPPVRPTPPPGPHPVPGHPQPVARVHPIQVAVPAQPAEPFAMPPPAPMPVPVPAMPTAAPLPPPPGRSVLPAPPLPSVAPAAPPPGAQVPPAPPSPGPEAAEEELDLTDEIEEADFFMQQGLFAEAREALSNLASFYPGHSQVGAKLAELERREASARRPRTATPPPVAPPRQATPPPAPPPSGVFDIGKELADELALEQVPPAEEFQYTVEEVFSQFKKGVSQVVKAEDTDTHYDLGIAYKEMGLTDDALSEFETALKGAGPAKQVDCLSMIGLCRMVRGDAGGAADAFRRALRLEAVRPEAARALQYELAAAYQTQGDTESALWYLHKVVRAEPGFRDAAARLATLGGGPGRAPPEASSPAPSTAGGPKKNIGYV